MEKAYDDSWEFLLAPLFEQESFKKLTAFLKEERTRFEVYPNEQLVFNAFKKTAFDEVKVVILGQDPYHNVGQAHGLSFSVLSDVAFPPSLRNILTELSTDIEGFIIPKSGDLTKWAEQGVLLLNSVLTVRAHEANSHEKQGWEIFTDQIISKLSDSHENVVFILWGAYAQKKISLIDSSRHLIIKSAHPSPLSVYRGFWGSKPFSKANTYLKANEKKLIDWKLS